MFDVNTLPTPLHVFDEKVFEGNLEILSQLKSSSGLKTLLALKGYNPTHSAGLVNEYLAGVSVSSLYEARSAFEHYTGEIHVYCPAYDEDSFEQLMSYVSHVVFNSNENLMRFAPLVPADVKIDLRVNLQHENTQAKVFDGYNPNKQFSRFGVTAEEFDPLLLEKHGVTGLHFHALNAQGSADLLDCVVTLERKFPAVLAHLDRINMGGGHKICHPDYDYNTLKKVVISLTAAHNIQVYIEPSEFVYTGVGVLRSKVLSIMKNEVEIAILNVSAKNHMPDLLESPYYCVEIEEGRRGCEEDEHKYILSGNTCLTGDVIDDYSFGKPLVVGDIITFKDTTAYGFCQEHWFNGVARPDRLVLDPDGNPKSYIKDEYKAFIGYGQDLITRKNMGDGVEFRKVS